MMRRTFLEQALEVFVDPSASPPMVEAAAAALITAAELGIGAPGSALALWRRAIDARKPLWSRQVQSAIAQMPLEQAILDEAQRIVTSPTPNEAAYETAVLILATPTYARHVSVESLLRFAEAAPGGDSAWGLVRLVEAVNDHGGGVPSSVLRSIRDLWSASNHVALRKQSVEVALLLDEPDFEWTRRMLADADQEVRRTLAMRARKLAGAPDICTLLEERLAVESHRKVRATLHDAISVLTEERSIEEQRIRDEIDIR
jgi:hypothetical protein